MDLCGCSYEGPYNSLKLFHTDPKNLATADEGKYTFENGSVYTGSFQDGEFSGEGVLEFPKSAGGMSIIGTWQRGRLLRGVLKFSDGLVFHFNNWKYCDGYDRRYWREITGSLPPSGRLNVIADNSNGSKPPPSYGMPNYALYTSDGYYDAIKREVYRIKNRKLLRIADDEEHEFIMRNCLRNWDAEISDEPRNRYLELPIGLPCHKRDAWQCGGGGRKEDDSKNCNANESKKPELAEKKANELQPEWQKLLTSSPQNSGEVDASVNVSP